MELTLLDVLAATDERDKDGSSVTQSQANDTNAGESVEGSGGTEVDEAESELDNHAEHHSVKRDVELGVDNAPHLVSGDGAIAGEGPGRARSSGGAANTAEQTEDEERDEKTDRGTGRANGLLDDDWGGLAGQKSGERGLVGQDEDERDQENETADGVQDHGSDHSLRHLGSRVSNFFAHPR